MEKETTTLSVTFKYLAEFRTWLYDNKEKEIMDITTTGEWGEMEIVVTYK